jgi:phenylpropionate dioxygenase-like ring-hydroxylating dioxygenase large terminal subunit
MLTNARPPHTANYTQAGNGWLQQWQPRSLKTAAVTLPAEMYSSPEVYRREQTEIFGKYWYYVGHTSQLAGSGSYFTVEIAEQPLVILRNKAGTLKAFFNICTHRAGPVALGSGQRQRLTCLYHAWSFDLEGNLRGIPDMELAENFDTAAHALTPAQVDTWGPFIFVNLDPQAEPLSVQLGELPELFQRYRLAEWALVHTQDYWMDANWKLHVENTAESYHEPNIHPAIAKAYQHLKVAARHFYYLQLSPIDTLLDETQKPYERGSGLCAEGLSPEEMEWLSVMSFFPNFAWILSPGYALIYLFDPIGPTRTRIRLQWLVPDTEVAKAPENVASLIERLEFIEMEDLRIMPELQKRVQSLSYHPGRLSPGREMGVHLFQELIRQAVFQG